MDKPQELDLARLNRLLQASSIGHTIDYHRTIASTMPRARQLAQDEAVRAGHLVVAEQQSAGKGRSGRSWIAPYAQALLVSVILKPPLIPANPAQIPMAAGIALAVALVEAAPELHGEVSLKWPNDVLLGHSGELGKVAGILSESAFDSAGPLYAVLGIGINVNQTNDALPLVEQRMTVPTSLRVLLGRTVDRTVLLAILCQQLTKQLAAERTPADLFDDWRSRLSTIGQSVTVIVHAGPVRDEVRGVAIDVSPDGELLVRDRSGRVHAFAAADVSVRDAR